VELQADIAERANTIEAQAVREAELQAKVGEHEKAIAVQIAREEEMQTRVSEHSAMRAEVERLRADAASSSQQQSGELQVAQREVQRLAAELATVGAEVTSLQSKNEWLQKSAADAQEVTELRVQVASLEASVELASQAAMQTDAELAAERQRSAALETQAQAAAHVADQSGDDARREESFNQRLKDLEAQLACAERDRDLAISRATSAERAVEERQEALARGSSRELENVPLLDNEDESPSALKARVRLLESQLSRAQGSSAALQDAASRAAERLQAQALKERELEQQLATAGATPQFFRHVVEGVGAVNSLVAGQVGRCLRGRQNDPPSPSQEPLPRI
jgi:chromosome segregation protein